MADGGLASHYNNRAAGQSNDQSVLETIKRLEGIHVFDSPILVSSANGMYAVHEKGWMGYSVNVYTQAQYNDRFKEDFPDGLVTVEDLRHDHGVIDKNRNHRDMTSEMIAGNGKLGAIAIRLEGIEADAKEAGVTLETQGSLLVSGANHTSNYAQTLGAPAR